MESQLRTAALTAIAPIAWGTTYIVTAELLPPGRPLFVAAIRALPAGLLLLAVRRQLPRGDWWWRSAVLGLVNFGIFFPLLFLGAFRLPGGLAATIQAAGPLAVMAFAWWLLRERPGVVRVGGAVIGLVGVGLLVLRAGVATDALGLAAAFASVAVSALGFVLVKRWKPPVDMLTLVAWQLTWGGLVLVPVAALVEGAPPALDLGAVAGLLWIALPGTVIAYVAWFHGLSRMPAGATALIGLLNPVVGTLLGVLLAGEVFGWPQALGMALVLGGVLAGQPSVAALARRRDAGPAPVPTASAPASSAAAVANGSQPLGVAASAAATSAGTLTDPTPSPGPTTR
jgi:probable blue pigment (indigoidine) exporter